MNLAKNNRPQHKALRNKYSGTEFHSEPHAEVFNFVLGWILIFNTLSLYVLICT